MNQINTEEATIKDIKNGKYRNYYLIYNRKSTDDMENQKNSISYQTKENRTFAYKNKLQIAPVSIENFMTDGIISERHSGFKENTELTFSKGNMVQFSVDRPKFYSLVNFLSDGYFKGVIILCWDRASRNKSDDTIIRKLMDRGIDIVFTLTKYDKSSSGELHMDVDGMFAKHHSRVTREKVTMTIKNSRSQGLCTNKAPVGYLNKGSMSDKPLDPERAPLITKMFEMASTGEWSLSDISTWATNNGFKMPPVRRRRTLEERLAVDGDDTRLKIEPIERLVTTNGVHKILTNPFYTGRVLGNNREYVTSMSHKALISDEVFNKVQEALKRKRVSVHYTEKIDLPDRGLVRCADCGRAYTPYMKKGIQYFNARCKLSCPNKHKNFNIDFLEDEVGKRIGKLPLTDEELEDIDKETKVDLSIFEEKRHKELEQYERRKKTLREDLTYLRTNKLPLLKAGTYTPEAFIDEETRLNRELASLQEKEQLSDASMHEVVKDLVKLSELVKYGLIHYQYANSREKEQIIKIIFSELSLSGDTLTFQCKNGFKALESRLNDISSPTGSRTPVNGLKTRCPNH